MASSSRIKDGSTFPELQSSLIIMVEKTSMLYPISTERDEHGWPTIIAASNRGEDEDNAKI